MCIDYRKLNKSTKKDHFPLAFIDEMLEQLANHSFFCFLDDCLENLEKVLQRCEEKHSVLNWKKCHFMVREGIVLGHLVFE